METIGTTRLTPEEVRRRVNMQQINTRRLRIPLLESSFSELILAETAMEVRKRGGSFEASDEQRMACRKIAHVLCNHELKCGVMILGKVGNGKTSIMRGLQQSFCWMVTMGYLDYGTGLRIVTAKDVHSREKDEARFSLLCNDELLGIDDLGVEPREEMVYGRVTTPMVDLLEYRYNRQLFTIVTSNLNEEQRRKKYGARLDDRFHEMFEKIVFMDDSYR